MDKLIIEGPAKLHGSVRISGSKNAALPILAATLLSNKKIKLKNVPNLADINTMFKLLGKLGVQISPTKDSHGFHFHTPKITSVQATYDLVKTMRASILVLGPLLAREKKAVVSLPGGCAIGSRPIDIHLDGLKQLGAQISLNSGYVEAHAPDGLKGNTLVLPFPSVGATENLIMAACHAHGKTIIKNAAKEPEITDLIDFLVKQGFKIEGKDSSEIQIEGVSLRSLEECEHSVIADRIEAATYIMAALITNSEVDVTHCDPQHLEYVLEVFRKMGAKFKLKKKSILVLKHSGLKGTEIDTAPFPGFPTDLQAQIMSLALIAEGPTVISEKIFENRFMHVQELLRLGADISLNQHTAVIKKSKLTGAPVMCTDLRASASLVLASLAASQTTEIHRIYHLDRGYEILDQKLRELGVKIQRISS